MLKARLRRVEVGGLAPFLTNARILTHGRRVGWLALEFSRRKGLRRRWRR